jgi:hypothetical protein
MDARELARIRPRTALRVAQILAFAAIPSSCGRADRAFEEGVVAAAEAGRFEEVIARFRRAKEENRLPKEWRDLTPPDPAADPRPLDPTKLPSVSPQSLVVLEPLGTIRSTRPRIRWHDPNGPRKVRVSISTRAGPLLQLETVGTQVEYPNHEPALHPHSGYWLQVTVVDDLRTGGSSDFGVAFLTESEQVEKRLEALREQLGEGPAFSLFAGSFLREKKLALEAASHFETLLRRFPDSRVLHEILARIYLDLGNPLYLRREMDALGAPSGR